MQTSTASKGTKDHHFTAVQAFPRGLVPVPSSLEVALK